LKGRKRLIVQAHELVEGLRDVVEEALLLGPLELACEHGRDRRGTA
jgi:hypothetical protein